MAHSNRKKLRDSRGGLTKNQASKLNKGTNSGSSAQASRLASISAWLDDKINGVSSKPTVQQTTVKKKKFDRSKPAMERRVTVISRLENQLKLGTKTEKISVLTLATTGADQIPLEEDDIKRINKEITILKSRVITS